ncbi:MAG: adenine phosphoribosyltransferase [Rhodobacteraceae bacterium]|nr:adenine phosphoribosyltransferase [Paracoccaceae bacterium]
MKRAEFNRLFKNSGPAVLPVIHVEDRTQALRNIATLSRAGAPGAFLINHDFDLTTFQPILRDLRRACPSLWMGVNFLAQPGDIAFPVLGALADEGLLIDAYWADDACIDERSTSQPRADAIAAARTTSGWNGLYFGGVSFKKQRPVPPEMDETAARIATDYMEIVTTSGAATGQEADLTKIRNFRAGIGDRPLAVASGITPDNAAAYCADVDCFLVATGINHPGDFYNIDPARLDALLTLTREYGAPNV